MKCGLKVSLVYRINLRVIQTELKMVVVIIDEVSFEEVSHTNFTCKNFKRYITISNGMVFKRISCKPSQAIVYMYSEPSL